MVTNKKLMVGAALAAAVVVAAAAPAFAHITVDPASAPRGGEIALRFRVPNEVTSANVTKVAIAFPTDHPLLGVVVEPLPGWSVTVSEARLNPPVPTDDGPVNQAVSEIVWAASSGGGTAPGQFQELTVLVQRLPTDVSQVVFKALQTYSDGSIVRWIDQAVAGQAPPDHPSPVLTLTAGASGNPAGAQPSASGAAGATSNDVSQARMLAVIGVVVGAVGLVVALLALALVRRPRQAGERP